MSNSQASKTNITVDSFYKAGKEQLKLDLVGGMSGLSGVITEAAINRPGLALSGFFQYFAHRRIQVLGLAEHTFLHSLKGGERKEKLRSVFKKKIPCLVVTRSKKIFSEITYLAEEFAIPVFKSRMITKDFINAATIILENLMAPKKNRQGTMVEIMGIGVLIEGKSGIGKSEAALALIKRGYALVSDDITSLRVDSTGSIIGAPVDVTRYHMEIRGLGIIHIPSLFGVASVREEKKLDLVVTLCEPGVYRDFGGMEKDGKCEILGVELPRIYVPVAPGRDIANVVETAALNQKLKRLGHDAVKELDEKLIHVMTDGKAGSD